MIIDKVDEKLSTKIDGVKDKLGKVEERLTGRIDKLGKQLAYLEDDAPTKEESDSLEKRVEKVEHKPT